MGVAKVEPHTIWKKFDCTYERNDVSTPGGKYVRSKQMVRTFTPAAALAAPPAAS